jgi:YVTN family beta-propeller protein
MGQREAICTKPNQVKVFNTADFAQVATIPVGKLPHGVWPSGDGSRIYVGLENDDLLAAIDTVTNKVVGTIPIEQSPTCRTRCRAATAQPTSSPWEARERRYI